MEVQETILARVIRLVKISNTVGYWPDLVNDLGVRYSFASLPDIKEILASQEKGAAKGAEFQVGKLKKSDGKLIVIGKFTVFNDGLVADCRTSTDDCDIFLDSIQEWAKTNLSAIKNVGRSLYLSQLEVKFNLQPNEYAKIFNPLGGQIAALLTGYGAPPGVMPFRFGSLTLAMEPGDAPSFKPSVFTIERRLNVPFDENVFYTQAPLRTSDHIALLNTLERTLSTI